MVETFGLYPKDNGRLLKSGGETTLAFLKDLLAAVRITDWERPGAGVECDRVHTSRAI